MKALRFRLALALLAALTLLLTALTACGGTSLPTAAPTAPAGQDSNPAPSARNLPAEGAFPFRDAKIIPESCNPRADVLQ